MSSRTTPARSASNRPLTSMVSKTPRKRSRKQSAKSVSLLDIMTSNVGTALLMPQMSARNRMALRAVSAQFARLVNSNIPQRVERKLLSYASRMWPAYEALNQPQRLERDEFMKERARLLNKNRFDDLDVFDDFPPPYDQDNFGVRLAHGYRPMVRNNRGELHIVFLTNDTASTKRTDMFNAFANGGMIVGITTIYLTVALTNVESRALCRALEVGALPGVTRVLVFSDDRSQIPGDIPYRIEHAPMFRALFARPTHVEVHGISSAEYNVVMRAFLRAGKKAVELDLSGFDVGDKFMHDLAFMRNIGALSLTSMNFWSSGLSDAGLKTLANAGPCPALSRLQDLELTVAGLITSRGISSIRSIIALNPSLQTVKLFSGGGSRILTRSHASRNRRPAAARRR